MKRKPQCKAPISVRMYDQIQYLYNVYSKCRKKGVNAKIEGVICEDIFDFYGVVNAKFDMNKSERTLRRICRAEYPRTMFEG